MAFRDGVSTDIADILGSGAEFSEALRYRTVRAGVAGPWTTVYGLAVEVEPLGIVGEGVGQDSLDVHIRKADVATVTAGSDQVERGGRPYRVKDVIAQDSASWRLHCAPA